MKVVSRWVLKLSGVISEGGAQPEMFLHHVSSPTCCFPPVLYIKKKVFLSQSSVYRGSSVLKALPTCLYVGQPRRTTRLFPQMSLRVVLPLSHDAIRWDSTASPHRLGGGASDSGRGSPYTFYKNRHETHNWSVSSPVTDEFLFFSTRSSVECVCVVSRRLYCWTTCASSHSGACLLYFFPAVLHRMPWFVYKSY